MRLEGASNKSLTEEMISGFSSKNLDKVRDCSKILLKRGEQTQRVWMNQIVDFTRSGAHFSVRNRSESEFFCQVVDLVASLELQQPHRYVDKAMKQVRDDRFLLLLRDRQSDDSDQPVLEAFFSHLIKIVTRLPEHDREKFIAKMNQTLIARAKHDITNPRLLAYLNALRDCPDEDWYRGALQESLQFVAKSDLSHEGKLSTVRGDVEVHVRRTFPLFEQMDVFFESFFREHNKAFDEEFYMSWASLIQSSKVKAPNRGLMLSYMLNSRLSPAEWSKEVDYSTRNEEFIENSGIDLQFEAERVLKDDLLIAKYCGFLCLCLLNKVTKLMLDFLRTTLANEKNPEMMFLHLLNQLLCLSSFREHDEEVRSALEGMNVPPKAFNNSYQSMLNRKKEILEGMAT